MSYQVIARKWRPQTFEEVTGQEHITRTLRNAIEHERLHHAYLFSGARGVGKTTTARLLAKAVNCHRADRPTPTPCRSNDPDPCPSCREIAEGRSIDVLEIDAASNTGVDNVRDAIINTVGVRPARDRYKVFIIDEVHMLSGAAFNALLKTLEEPPPRVLFIMATTESHKVPATILSRCQQFEFRTIAAPKIAERLRLIADAEKIEVSDEALREVARAGEGSMRDAQSAFDQVISFSEGRIETADVEAALGLASRELLSNVVRAVAEGRPDRALAVVDDLVMRGHDLRNFCRDLMGHVRDLLVTKAAGDSASSDAERKRLFEEASDFTESDLVRFFNSLTQTEQHLRESAHPRYQLEVGLVRLVEMRRLAPLADLLKRLGALEEALRTGRAPLAATTPGTSTPPSAAPSGGAAPRRGGATGGGTLTGAAATTTSTPTSTPTPQPPPPTLTTNAQTARPSSSTVEPTSAAAPNLKLVPAPARSTHANATDDAAPFPLEDEPPPSSATKTTTTTAAARPSSFAREAPQEPDYFADLPPGADAAGPPVAFAPSPSQDDNGDLVSRVKLALEARKKHLLAVALEGALRVVCDGGELRAEFAPEAKHLRDTLEKADNRRVLREVCAELTGRETEVRVVVQQPGAGGDARQDEARLEQQRLRERAESDPRVRQMLKTFRAEIVEVRRPDAEPV